jgi:hypothetical protein
MVQFDAHTILLRGDNLDEVEVDIHIYLCVIMLRISDAKFRNYGNLDYSDSCRTVTEQVSL